MLRAEIPEVVKEIIFGGRLIALQKKSGGIRPIAIGYTWRRLVAKCACKYATKKLAPLLSPLQLGVGVPNGCEAAVHAARRFIEDLRGDRAFVKLDFTNAFNSLRRDRMLTAVSTELPELYDFCQASYGKSSILKFGTYDVFSEEGVQQGDPLGPLLFCITLHELLEGLQSDLRIGYLDDISIGGDGVDLAHDLNKIIAGGKEIGLQLNVSKCEIIKSPDFIDRVEFQNFTHIDKINACLLGAPLSTGPANEHMPFNPLWWSNSRYWTTWSPAITRRTHHIEISSQHTKAHVYAKVVPLHESHWAGAIWFHFALWVIKNSECFHYWYRLDSGQSSGLRGWVGNSKRCSLGTISLFGFRREHAGSPISDSSGLWNRSRFVNWYDKIVMAIKVWSHWTPPGNRSQTASVGPGSHW